MLDDQFERGDYSYENDDADNTFHLGAFIAGRLVSVASFFFVKHPCLKDPYQFRLRGMATLPEFQRKGLSATLVKTAFPIVKQNFCTLLWCDSRETAIEFYKRIGFQEAPKSYGFESVGTKHLMFKEV